MANFIKKLFCKHEYEFHSNAYGDMIYQGGFHRSNWYCKKCGQWQGRDYLVHTPLKDVIADMH